MINTAIRIVLIEPQELVRVGLATALAKQVPKAEVVGHTGISETGRTFIRTKSPNLVILNLDLPEMNGLELIEFVKRYSAKIKVMVLTANRELETVLPAFDAGADSYCLLHHPIGLITTALQHTHQGNHWIDPEIAQYLIYRQSPLPSRSELPEPEPVIQLFDESWQMIEQLTTREVDVLELMAKGLTNNEIATHLYIGSGTVKSHVASLMQKFGARSRTEAASRALNSGILSQYRRNLA
jgi:two-component system, NarL family, response regulator LiaR